MTRSNKVITPNTRLTDEDILELIRDTRDTLDEMDEALLSIMRELSRRGGTGDGS